jgi:hypothetical protein
MVLGKHACAISLIRIFRLLVVCMFFQGPLTKLQHIDGSANNMQRSDLHISLLLSASYIFYCVLCLLQSCHKFALLRKVRYPSNLVCLLYHLPLIDIAPFVAQLVGRVLRPVRLAHSEKL